MSRRNEILTGVFVLLGIGLIVAGALWLSESRWRGEFDTLRARFSTVGQLQTGNPVTLRGVRVGSIQAIEVVDTGVEVTMRVQEGLPLPEDPLVVVRPVSLFGEWAASLTSRAARDGEPPDTVPHPEGTLAGVTSADFMELAQSGGDIAANLQTITDRLTVAFDEETAREFSRSIRNLERASDELVGLMARQRESFGDFAQDMSQAGRTLRKVSADLDSTVSRLEAATAEGELEQILDNTRRASASLDTLSRQLRGTTGEARTTIARADSVLRRADAILAGVQRGEGSVGRLARDEAVYEDLASALTELRALLDDLKRNPDKYFKFSIF
jgi:phospholipid/cholesterol/gamma-HCH transport system substrate-binding protein